ncbi:MAG: universal stress protein [Candidatus Brocadiales bacterium]
MVSIKKILCPVDYSVCSSEAMKYAAHIAGGEGAQMYLMHVIDIRSFGHESPLDFEVPKPTQEVIERIRKELAEDLVHERDGKKVEVEAIVVVGKPVEEILKVAKEKEVDMIVMGTHGRTGIPHVIIGSVAENVVRKAPCPVLTVRHP